MLVKDRMTPQPICGRPAMPMPEIQSLMQENGIRHLPIVDDDGTLVGLITQRSLMRALPSDVSNFSRFEIGYVLGRIKARDVMVENVITIGEDTAIEEAARIMADAKIGCLPVMQGDDPSTGFAKHPEHSERTGQRLVGIITDNDIFTTMVDLLGARRPGIRVTVLQPDRAGEMARLTTAIAKEGGYLSVCVGYYPTGLPDTWASVCKVINVPSERLLEAINSLEGARIQDVREVEE